MSSSSSSSSLPYLSSSSATMLSSSSSSEAPCAIGIRLKRFAQKRFYVNKTDGFRFRVIAYDACGMPDKVFRYRREPGVKAGEEQDSFNGICSPVDLYEYPEDNPDAGKPFPFFRRNEVDMVFRSQIDANAAWEAIKNEVDSLIITLKMMEDLVEDEIAEFGTPA